MDRIIDRVYWIEASGQNSFDETITWKVAQYVNIELADSHLGACRDFLRKAEEEIPLGIAEHARRAALKSLHHPSDSQYRRMGCAKVDYKLKCDTVQTILPFSTHARTLPAFGPVDTENEEFKSLVTNLVARVVHHDEPFVCVEHLAEMLWALGVNPGLPALNAKPEETGARALERLYRARVSESRPKDSRVFSTKVKYNFRYEYRR